MSQSQAYVTWLKEWQLACSKCNSPHRQSQQRPVLLRDTDSSEGKRKLQLGTPGAHSSHMAPAADVNLRHVYCLDAICLLLRTGVVNFSDKKESADLY